MKLFKWFFSVVLLSVCSIATAQHLPGDKTVRKGKLENGLTYYICHNENPAQRAEFYLATNVGAIQETADQDGLAHFLEHMCFNGTKNFPGKGILNYLQSIGASFGGNVNASTGVEETIYMLNNIPLVDASVVDSCLLILHDYSHFVTCAPEEIDKERGVILEERRSRRDASWRLNEKSKPFIYGNSKYAECSLIGSEENLKTFAPESLTSFYSTWYRPDLQAVIVVGDVDVDEVESKIAATWSDIPAPDNPQAKTVTAIPSNDNPAIGILTDPEFPTVNLAFYWKFPVKSEEGNDTAPYIVESLVKEIVAHAMRERLTDIAAKTESPFTQATFSSLNVCETMDANAMILIPKEGQWEECVRVAVTEAEKLRRFGLNETEVSRAKAEIFSAYETAANKASTRRNSEFVAPLIANFFDNHEYLAPKDKFSFVKGILPQLHLSMINASASGMITDENLTVLYYGTEKEGVNIPSAEQIQEVVSSVKSSDIQPDEEEVVAASFVDPASLPGAAVKKSSSTVFGATEWTLKNGARVVLLPTDYEKDKVQIQLVKRGGRSLISDEELVSFEATIWTMFQMNRGVSDFSAADVKKMLSGKNASAQAYIAPYTHGISAASSRKDLETAFQLAYLQFCDPRFDEAEYNQALQTIAPILQNLENMPQFHFSREACKTAYGNYRHPLISKEVVESASLSTIDRVYRRMFNDASGLVAIVVGDFNITDIQPLVEKYIGSIPRGHKPLKWCNRKDGVVGGVLTDEFSVKMTTPKVTVSQIYTMDNPFSAHLDASMDALQYILNMVYTETLREEEGGTYGAHVSVVAGQDPDRQDILEIDFETNPDSADRLRSIARDGLNSIAKDGPTPDHFDKALKNLQKKIPEGRQRNAYWLVGLEQWYVHGINYIDEYEAAVNSLTAGDIQAVAAAFADSGNYIELVMRPQANN